MERRLLLSTTPLQLQLTSVSPNLLSGVSFNPNPSSANTGAGSATNDGGFIDLQPTLSAVSPSGVTTNSTGSNFDFPYDPGLLVQFNDVTISVHVPRSVSDGLHPWPIESPEVGAIPIYPVAGIRRELDPAPTSRQLEPQLTATATTLSPKSQSVAPAETSISGEWARAVVFELAAEATHAPIQSTQHGPTSHSPDVRNPAHSNGPVSAEEPQHANAPTHALIDRQPVTAVPAVEKQHQPPIPMTAPSGHDVSAVLYGEAIEQLFSSTRTSANSAKEGQNEVGVEHASFAVAYQATGADISPAKAPAFEPTGKNNKWWLDSCVAAPLVVVLALERIAALNSRRAATAPYTKSTSQPTAI